MAQQVRALELRNQAGPPERAANDTADGRRADEASPGRTGPNEDAACRTSRPVLTQIVDQGCPDIRRQRQPCQPLTFAVHNDLAAFPIEIVQGHGGDLAAAQAEPREQHQDGVIATTRRLPTITRRQQTFDLFGRQRFRQVRQTPAGDTRHRGGEIGRQQSALHQEAQKRTQRRDHQLRTATGSGLGSAHDEPMNIDRPQIIEMQHLAAKLLIQKTSNDRQIVDQCCRGKTTLRPQEFSKCADQFAHRARIGQALRHRNAADVAQIFDQLPNGPCIASPDAASTFSQELTGVVPSEDIQRNIPFRQPNAEICQEVNLVPNSRRGITLAIE
ncbi:MAG: hypothetical protein WDN69_24685 [Aliidongia sp.]